VKLFSAGRDRIPSAALDETLLVRPQPRVLGDQAAVHVVDGGVDAAAQQIAAIITEMRAARPWLTDAEVARLAEQRRQAVENAQRQAAGVQSRVGRPNKLYRARGTTPRRG